MTFARPTGPTPPPACRRWLKRPSTAAPAPPRPPPASRLGWGLPHPLASRRSRLTLPTASNLPPRPRSTPRPSARPSSQRWGARRTGARGARAGARLHRPERGAHRMLLRGVRGHHRSGVRRGRARAGLAVAARGDFESGSCAARAPSARNVSGASLERIPSPGFESGESFPISALKVPGFQRQSRDPPLHIVTSSLVSCDINDFVHVARPRVVT